MSLSVRVCLRVLCSLHRMLTAALFDWNDI